MLDQSDEANKEGITRVDQSITYVFVELWQGNVNLGLCLALVCVPHDNDSGSTVDGDTQIYNPDLRAGLYAP